MKRFLLPFYVIVASATTAAGQYLKAPPVPKLAVTKNPVATKGPISPVDPNKAAVTKKPVAAATVADGNLKALRTPKVAVTKKTAATKGPVALVDPKVAASKKSPHATKKPVSFDQSTKLSPNNIWR
jgi:hypothetical protein